jgi:hypothetical protein
MRLLIAIALLLAFLTNGAVAQFRAEANTGAALAMSKDSLVSNTFTGHWTTGKVCMRKLLTGLPDENTSPPGPPCSGDFKLFRDVEMLRFPDTRPRFSASAERKLQPDGSGSPFRPPIS